MQYDRREKREKQSQTTFPEPGYFTWKKKHLKSLKHHKVKYLLFKLVLESLIRSFLNASEIIIDDISLIVSDV